MGERCHRLDSDETVLAAAAKQQLVRIGERGPVVERQPNSIRRCRDRDNAIGRSLGRTASNDEKVVVVVDQFICRWQALAQHFSRCPDQCCIFRIEFVDKARKLLLACGSALRSGSRSLHNGVSVFLPKLMTSIARTDYTVGAV